jgi:predicted RNA binding protein YcfA (HicA-like mRNA interferase family)
VPPLPRITARETVRKLEHDGWLLARQTGAHAHYQHATKRGTVTVPMHIARILTPAVLLNILRQAGLTVEEFISL